MTCGISDMGPPKRLWPPKRLRNTVLKPKDLCSIPRSGVNMEGKNQFTHTLQPPNTHRDVRTTLSPHTLIRFKDSKEVYIHELFPTSHNLAAARCSTVSKPRLHFWTRRGIVASTSAAFFPITILSGLGNSFETFNQQHTIICLVRCRGQAQLWGGFRWSMWPWL